MRVLVHLMPVNQVRQFAFHLGPPLNFVLMISLFASSLPALQVTLASLGPVEVACLTSLGAGSWSGTLYLQCGLAVGHYMAHKL